MRMSNNSQRVISEETKRKLQLSWLEARGMKFRNIRCPICNYVVAKIPVNQKEMLYVKCQKCKEENYLSPIYFRTVKKLQPIG
ncbi:MAG: hypothetical protein Q4C42_08980 [Clostridia bacterium]|nr:hypothetical protein [Clostridia bacterium]